jgi:hypothetical protein
MFGRKTKIVSRAESPARGYDSFEMRLGDEMRGERATQGKSLLDVQRELRIRASYVAAIENADLSAFDSLSFVAGYVRSYARYLDMDPEIVFARFCEETGFDSFKSLRPLDSELARRSALGADLGRKPLRMATAAKSRAPVVDPVLGMGSPFAKKVKPAFDGFEPGALGSLAVLILLVGGIGYGGWALVKEIQRVTVAPVEGAPVLQAELDPLAAAALPMPATPEAPEVETPEIDPLERFYRPQALEAPVLTARDAPIATLRPGALGAFARAGEEADQSPLRSVALDSAGSGFPSDVQIAAAVEGVLSEVLIEPEGVTDAPQPPRVLADEPLPVVIVAARETWVRLRAGDGSALLERVMQPGETFEVPILDEPLTLRTGNAGAVYFSMAGQTYGPVAPGVQVVNVEISADLIARDYAAADLSRDGDLARVVAELQVPGLVDGAPSN